MSLTKCSIAASLGLHIAVDEAIRRQWIVPIGRHSARDHAPHLFCEMFLRLQAVGLTEGSSFKLPLPQAELGDTLGLSTVHVNRILQEQPQCCRTEGCERCGRDQLPKSNPREFIVELRNEYGQRVLTVTVSMKVERVDPEPPPPA